MMQVYFAGATGPTASGGPMGIAVVVPHGFTGAAFIAGGCEASRHSATYQALAMACWALMDQPGWNGRTEVEFLSDNEMVVGQLQGWRRAKGGHYLQGREEALAVLVQAFPHQEVQPRFRQVPFADNPANVEAQRVLVERGIEPWSYKKKPSEPSGLTS